MSIENPGFSQLRFGSSAVQIGNMEAAQKEFTDQDTIEIPSDADCGNQEQYKGNPNQDSHSIMKQGTGSFSESVQDTGQCCIHVKKRTDKGQGTDIGSGCRTFKKKIAQIRPKEKKSEVQKFQGTDSRYRLRW